MPAYVIDLYTGTVPLRDGSQTNTQFSDNVGDLLAYIPPLAEDINASNVWVNGVNVAVQALADAAATSESNAATSAAASANSANFKGAWSSLTGALNKPAQVLHNGAYWQLLNNLTNVALSEPAPGNADWAFASGTRWVTPYTASATLAVNSFNTVIATSAPANMTLPAVAVNDFVVIHNSPTSTQTVKLINASYTIRSKYFTASPSDNCILGADEVFYAKCVATNVLEVVS